MESRAEIAQVATISANNDPEVGEIIADALDKVGKDGVVTVEESNTFGIEIEFAEGMQLDRGFLSPHFVTDQERQEVGARRALHPDRQPEDQRRPATCCRSSRR